MHTRCAFTLSELARPSKGTILWVPVILLSSSISECGTQRDEVRVVSGPDTQTSCGDEDRRLQIGTEYIAGIGGRCSPIDQWSERSSYSSEEIHQLRNEMDCGATSLFSFSLALSLIPIAIATMLQVWTHPTSYVQCPHSVSRVMSFLLLCKICNYYYLLEP